MKSRIKLFSSIRTVICRDCGHRLETAESTGSIICPNCGGKRFDVSLFPKKERVSVIEGFESNLEKNLKEFSGKCIPEDQFQKTFSEHEELLEKGFAEKQEDGTIEIKNFAYAMEKAFSKVIISVTKTLVLDPAIMRGQEDKEEVIEGLRSSLPEKSILLLRKAHGLPRQNEFSETTETPEDWIETSSIIPDLSTEYHNQSFGIEQFVKMLRERYPDAPENIIDILTEREILFVSGGQVTIK